MKHLYKLFLVLLVFSLPVLAQDPIPAVQRGHVDRFTRYIGRHVKETFTDFTHDKEWAAVVTLSAMAEAADSTTTCIGFNHGFQESNPVYFHTHSCPKLVIGSSFLFVTRMTATHVVWKELVAKCRYDATNGPHREWWQSYDPESCKHVMWIGVLNVPVNAIGAYGNVCLLNGGCVIKPKKVGP